jgi:nucleoside phosphorylase
MQGNFDTISSWRSVDVLIVTALPEEKKAILRLLEKLGSVQAIEYPLFYICTLPGRNGEYRIAVTQLIQMGNVEASIHATQAIDKLNPACVLMVGIAAGIKDRVSLGDVIVSTQVLYYEQAKQTPKGPEIRPISVPADRFLLQNAQNLNNNGRWRSLITVKNPLCGESDPPSLCFGPFAVGDKVVADRAYLSELMSLHPKLIGVEMESYGVAAAAASAPTRPRFLAIRGVSDFADEKKDDIYRKYASAVAAAFAIGFLCYGPLSPSVLRSPTTGVPSENPGSLIAIRHLSMQHIPSRTIIESLLPQFVGLGVTELLVDQTDLYVDGRLSDPLEAARRQGNLEYHIDSLRDSHSGALVSYFGIAHIPLLFYSGYCLTNKRKLHFFEFNRYTGQWEYLQGENEYPELKIDNLPTQSKGEQGDVLIRVSISNTVRMDEIVEIVPSPIASVHLRIEPPQRDAVISEQQLHDYGAKYRQILDTIHELLPNRGRTHIFYAGPVALAVYFGQLIIQTIDREIVIYNYTEKDFPRYSWGLKITSSIDSDDFLVRPNLQGEI